MLTGQVASNKAGPAVILSFALAALASAFSALCYAEFAGLVPKAGSAYAYSYITVGEFVAFIIGWNLILEYVIGTSSVARGFSSYLRFVCEHVAQSFGLANSSPSQLTNEPINNFSNISTTAAPLQQQTPANISTVGNQTLSVVIGNSIIITNRSQTLWEAIAAYVYEYFDWPSIVIIAIVTMFILFGVKESTNTTLAFTSLNLLVVLAVVISSFGSLDIHNWQLSKQEVPTGYGEGGFFPYGWSGVLAGSSTCFFGFIGFDTIASSAEEAKNPKRNVPLSIIASLFISFLAYMAIALVQTLLWPYYDQNNVTILPYIFDKLNMPITYWVVLLGAIAGLTSSQLGGMYPLPRILYSMAHDKLIYGWISHVNKRLKLPVRATIVGSVFVAILACLLDIQDLADMVSIGTLAAYSLVSLSVLILRYEDRSDAVDDSTIMSNHLSFTDILGMSEIDHTVPGIELSQHFNGDPILKNPQGVKREASIVPQEFNCKAKLAPKPSTPIRQKGSKAIEAQLSVGFNSWFKQRDENEELATNAHAAKTEKDKGWLHLLISWRAEDKKFYDRAPDEETSGKSKKLISIIVVLTVILDLIAFCLTRGLDSSSNPGDNHALINFLSRLQIVDSNTFMICSGSMILVILLAVMIMLSRLPVCRTVPSEMFQVPLVPLIPTLSIFVNTFLMLNLSFLTWVRFTVWMTAGFFIYFSYGIWKSEGYLLKMEP